MQFLIKSTPQAERLIFNAIKAKILKHLERLEKEEAEGVQKAFSELTSLMIKGGKGLPVGTIREWKGKKFIKVAPGKWKPKYEAVTRGARMSVAAIKRKVIACDDAHEMMQIMIDNKDRFSDEHGEPLRCVQELSDFIDQTKESKAAEWKKREEKEKKEAEKQAKKEAREKQKREKEEAKRKKQEEAAARKQKKAEEKGSAGGGDDGNNKNKKSYTKTLRTKLKKNLQAQIGLHKNKKTGIEARLSGSSIDKIGSDKAIEKSKNNGFTVDDHFAIANKIVELYTNADLVEVSPDKRNSPENP